MRGVYMFFCRKRLLHSISLFFNMVDTTDLFAILIGIIGIIAVFFILFTLIGIPIVEYKQYDNVTVNSKWFHKSCGRYGCFDAPMITTSSGTFSVNSSIYSNIQINRSYLFNTVEIGMGYGTLCQNNMCRVVQNATVI